MVYFLLVDFCYWVWLLLVFFLEECCELVDVFVDGNMGLLFFLLFGVVVLVLLLLLFVCFWLISMIVLLCFVKYCMIEFLDGMMKIIVMEVGVFVVFFFFFLVVLSLLLLFLMLVLNFECSMFIKFLSFCCCFIWC